MNREDYDPEEWAAMCRQFRDPGGRSALGPGRRTESCPTCETPRCLTRGDRANGYQCDRCADAAERGF